VKASFHPLFEPASKSGDTKKSPCPHSKASYLHLAAIVLLCLLIYSNALTNGFVFDDIYQVVNNPWIRDVRHLPQIFSKGVWAFKGSESNYYRPMMYFFYLLTYTAAGLTPWVFHLVSILFHTGVSVLVYLTGVRLMEGAIPRRDVSPALPSFFAAALFASHPIHVEAVAWISCLPELVYSFFSLLAFYLYIRFRGRKAALSFSLLSFFLACLSKEPALTLPLVIAAYEYTAGKERGRFVEIIKRCLPYFAVAGVYVVIRVFALGGFVPLKSSVHLDMAQYVINIPVLFTLYLITVFFPINLNIWHVFHPVSSALSLPALLSFFATAAYLFSLLRAAIKRSVTFLFLLLFLLPLLPSLYIVALPQGIGNVFTERYAYLPSLGLLYCLSFLACRAAEDRGRRFTALLLALVLVTGLFSVLTFHRNTVWKDEYSLWSDAVRKSPDGYMPHNNLGVSYVSRGDDAKAVEQFRIAIRLKPDYAPAHRNLALAYRRMGQLDLAIAEFRAALILRPNFDAYKELGIAYRENKEYTQAIDCLLNALRLDGRDADVHYDLGLAYANTGVIGLAIEHLETAARLRPDDPLMRSGLDLANELRRSEVQRR
jgi:tetratricopeptide (TPR) repeat protein